MLAVLLAALESDADRQKFIEIYEQYHVQMERAAMRIPKEQRDVEDAVQNAFVQIIRHFEKVYKIPCDNLPFWCISIMKKSKRMITTILAVITLLTVTYIPAFATEVGIDDETLQIEATELLDKLLTEQFEANKTGTLIDTNNTLANTSGTALYKQYLYWYSGKCAATQEYWTDYHYTLDFDRIDDGMVVFNADLSYGRTCSKYNSEAYGYEYRIRLTEEDRKFLISDIDTEEMNFYGFKNLITGGVENGIALMSNDVAPVSTDTLDAMIADYADMKDTMSSMVIDSADKVSFAA